MTEDLGKLKRFRQSQAPQGGLLGALLSSVLLQGGSMRICEHACDRCRGGD